MAARQVRASVERMIARHRLWAPGARLVVAVSGGADSLCVLGTLLDLRAGKRPLAPGELIVAHLDHGLRGEAGSADATWVAQLAEELGV
ncbi:MAG TPA: ATP-binding protein, partial [Ktedonobacterales bacterium]